MNKVLFISECEVDLDGLSARLHCTVEDIRARLHKNPEAFAREVAKNPCHFKFFGDIDLGDMSEPLVLGRAVQTIGDELHSFVSDMRAGAIK